MNCKECKYWKDRNSIQDVYPDMDNSIPIRWGFCLNEAYKASINIFPKDEKYADFALEKQVEYFGLDSDGRFRRNAEYEYETSELFGCVFYTK